MLSGGIKRCTRHILLFCVGVTVITFIITGSQQYIPDGYHIYGINTTLLKINVKLKRPNVSQAGHQAHLLSNVSQVGHQAHLLSNVSQAGHQAHLLPNVSQAGHQVHLLPNVSKAGHQAHVLLQTNNNLKEHHDISYTQDASFHNANAVGKGFLPNQTKRLNDIKDKYEHRKAMMTVNIDRNASVVIKHADSNRKQFQDIITLKAALKNKKGPKIVIILAYMHTGSSYTARIIKNHPGTFYEFEPLRSLQDNSRRKHWIQFLNGTTRRLVGYEVDTNVGAEAVSNIITCNHEKLDIATLSTTDRVAGDNSHSRDFVECLNSGHAPLSTLRPDPRQGRQTQLSRMHSAKPSWNPKKFQKSRIMRDFRGEYRGGEYRGGEYRADRYRRTQQRRVLPRSFPRRAAYRPQVSSGLNLQVHHLSAVKENIAACLPRLTHKCKNADIRLTKFIRMTMEMAGNLLKTNDNVRVIHLLRDPRAMMDSELRKQEMGVNIFRFFVKRTDYMCSRMLRDLDFSLSLKKLYPDNLFTLRYEDLVDDPLKTGQRIFDFIGVPFTSNDKQYIKSTSIELERNATDRANVWRDHITQQHLQAVDRSCKELYEKLGYIRFRSVAGVRKLDLADHLKTFNISDLIN